MVANTLMRKEASNIFFPQFVLKQRPHVVQQTIESWCDANKVDASASFDDAKILAMELEVRKAFGFHHHHKSQFFLIAK